MTTVLEIARYEGRKRTRGAAVVTAAISGFALFYVVLYPTFADALGEDIDRILEAYPDALMDSFGVKTLSSIEGFLASELYTFAWLLLVGLYFAYTAASLVADDVERERMDLLLSLPVSRGRVVVEKYASLFVPLFALSVAVPTVVYVGAAAVDHPVSAVDLVALHLLSAPYLLVCAGVGLLASVQFDRASVAQRVALGVLAALFFAESLLSGTDVAWMGAIAPSRYVDPNAVLLESQYAALDSLLLLVGTLAFVAASVLRFLRKDIE